MYLGRIGVRYSYECIDKIDRMYMFQYQQSFRIFNVFGYPIVRRFVPQDQQANNVVHGAYIDLSNTNNSLFRLKLSSDWLVDPEARIGGRWDSPAGAFHWRGGYRTLVIVKIL